MRQDELRTVESRFFESPDSSNQKLFSLDLLQSAFYLLLFELPIFRIKFNFSRRFSKNLDSIVFEAVECSNVLKFTK